jgi:hypothetical protein
VKVRWTSLRESVRYSNVVWRPRRQGRCRRRWRASAAAVCRVRSLPLGGGYRPPGHRSRCRNRPGTSKPPGGTRCSCPGVADLAGRVSVTVADLPNCPFGQLGGVNVS